MRLRAVGRHQTLTPRGPVHETEAPASAAAAYALTDKVSVAVKYRYFDLGKETYNLGAFTPAGAAAQTVSNSISLTSSQVTARLNFKLNGLGLFGM